MSKLEVDAIEPQSGTTLTLGASGDTVTVASGASFASIGIDDNATSTAITIDSSENVGIGTAIPTTKLDVAGSILLSSGANNSITINRTTALSGWNITMGQKDKTHILLVMMLEISILM
jgi:hypothetical protein